jgi:hypothetical protein
MRPTLVPSLEGCGSDAIASIVLTLDDYVADSRRFHTQNLRAVGELPRALPMSIARWGRRG